MIVALVLILAGVGKVVADVVRLPNPVNKTNNGALI